MPRPFRFGVQISNAASRDDWIAFARRAEDLGFSTIFMPDHFGDQLAPVPALMAAADATTTLRIGSLVLDNDYKHPVVVAKEAATIDVLSDGRLEFGIGAGWMRSDYDQSGMSYDPPGVRIERMTEGLAVIKGLMAGGAFSFDGKHYTIAELDGRPKPIQKPHPPILVGGGGRRVLQIAAREADIVGINVDLRAGYIGPDAGPNATAEATAQKVRWIREAAGDRFDGLELNVLCLMCVVTDDRMQVAENSAAMFGLTPEQALEIPHALVGTVGEIIDDLERRRETFGISYTVVPGPSMDAFAPVVAKLTGA
jgi:probable F420-dependent oxidoreductase